VFVIAGQQKIGCLVNIVHGWDDIVIARQDDGTPALMSSAAWCDQTFEPGQPLPPER
jgi:hypothetical protein